MAGESIPGLLFSFIKLYYSEDFFTSNFMVGMLILYATAGFYLYDFYQLVKTKSTAETYSIMSFPALFSMVGATMATMFLNVPQTGSVRMKLFAAYFDYSKTYEALFPVYLSYAVVWAVTFVSQKNRDERYRKRWVVSCVMDYICAACGFVCCAWYVFTGKSIFSEFGMVVLKVYLYTFYYLVCKIILLVLGLIVRAYSVRLTFIKWREGKNASRFLLRYFLLYQNAIFRNVVLLELGILIPLTIVVSMEGWNVEMMAAFAFLYVGGAFVVTISSSTAIKALDSFSLWGDKKKIKEMFCREYFCGEHNISGAGYTVTRHFLVDENSPAAVYFLPMLKRNSVVVNDGKTFRILEFADGKTCRIDKKDFEEVYMLVNYLKQYVTDIPADSVKKAGPAANRLQGIIMKFAVLVIILMYICMEIVRSGGK